MEKIIFLLDASRGIYLPQAAAEALRFGQPGGWQGAPDWAVRALRAGPDHPDYWEAWDAALDAASYTDADGAVWCLHQDGDLFAICPSRMTDAELEELG